MQLRSQVVAICDHLGFLDLRQIANTVPAGDRSRKWPRANPGPGRVGGRGIAA
jgi:hypothetical protein